MQGIKKLFTTEKVLYAAALNGGLLLTALGIHFFKAPNHFAFGGTSGISILAASLVPQLNVGAFMFIVNGILVVVGLVALGRTVMGVTLYSSFVLSAFVEGLDRLFPLAQPLTQDTMLELCFAVILPAAGSALIFNIGASSGGTDILAMILAQKTSLEIGKALLLSDALIVVGSGLLFGVRTGLYCMLGLLAKAFVVDGVIDGINSRKLITIVSDEPEMAKEFIMKQMRRGATVYRAYGAFSGKEEQVITTVLGRRQAVLLRNYLRKNDPSAFLTIVDSSETVGKGFRAM